MKDKPQSFSKLVAQSQQMHEIFSTVQRIADFKTTVMLLGESGTGKELIARAIHDNSNRRKKKFVAINCGAIPENLLESELFGHKKGSFTDATKDKKGLFEEADGGTLLLDEIGELPMHLQVKILRALQEGEIRPVGSGETISVDVRIIAATLRDIEADILEGRFRDDLYYRLNVVTIELPPLRERKDDILPLAEHFLRENSKKLGLPVRGFSADAIELLMQHNWPGNVRELENCVERAMIMTEGDSITAESLPRALQKEVVSVEAENLFPEISDKDLSIKKHARLLEKDLISRALKKTRGNRTHAAKLLEISHRALLYKLKDYGLE